MEEQNQKETVNTAEELKKEAVDTAKEVKEAVKNTDIKQDVNKTKGFYQIYSKILSKKLKQ